MAENKAAPHTTCSICSRLADTDYEFLVNGSEDEEYLTRLFDEEAAAYLSKT